MKTAKISMSIIWRNRFSSGNEMTIKGSLLKWLLIFGLFSNKKNNFFISFANLKKNKENFVSKMRVKTMLRENVR